MTKPVLISPSILSADFSQLGLEVIRLDKAGADWIHIDVMDGHFVPNITIGPDVIKSLRPCTSLPFDVHLMIAPVDPYIEAFRNAGADIISIHPESGPHLDRSLKLIRQLGAKAGVVLNPATPIAAIENVLEEIDLVMLMSVNPGFGGQSFMPKTLKKIEQIRTLIDHLGLDIIIEVDGGVNADNAPQCIAAGANALVAGTAVFKGGDYVANIKTLKGQ